MVRRQLRFHLDEQIPKAVAEGLRRHGIDVTTTAEVGLIGADDLAQLNFACQEKRVLVTCDADFLRLHVKGVEHAGIAFCHQGERSIGDVIRTLLLMYELLDPDEMRGHVEFL